MTVSRSCREGDAELLAVRVQINRLNPAQRFDHPQRTVVLRGRQQVHEAQLELFGERRDHIRHTLASLAAYGDWDTGGRIPGSRTG